ncbi:HflX-like GTP-binding protein, partial [Staphylococcus aureus]
MAQQQIQDNKKKQEKAVLVGVHAKDDKQFKFESTMEELSSLSETCQIEVLGQITQNRDSVDRKNYVGKGKIEEMQAYIEFKDMDVV